jgi:hypothetical protein
MEIGKADRARDHAEKTAVGSRDAPAQHDRIGTPVQHRLADEQADVGMLAMNPKILFFAAIFRHRIEARSVDGQPALRIEHLDRAEMLGGRGMIEQDQVADFLADILDLRHHQTAGDRAQRQVVQFDIAADIGVDAGGQILQRLPRQLFLVAAHVEHDEGANRGKADHGRNRRGDQQLCR